MHWSMVWLLVRGFQKWWYPQKWLVMEHPIKIYDLGIPRNAKFVIYWVDSKLITPVWS